MTYEIEWRPSAIEDMTELFEYLAENTSLWDARNRLIAATDRLVDYPRLYEIDERYGEGGTLLAYPFLVQPYFLNAGVASSVCSHAANRRVSSFAS
ncbi:TPA: type II toxin-antitoxin system RelE/ParE family toxin [Salmonella enterica subsp. enterica serovar Reading]